MAVPRGCRRSGSAAWGEWRGGGAAAAGSIAQRRSGGLERVLALLPVARAKLVGLQRVDDPQYFLGVAADAEVGHVDEANHALGIDDVSRALRHSGLGIEDAERGREL